MKIILSNGLELNPIAVTGEKRHLHGINRDALRFVFSADTSLDELDGVFTATNCEDITIIEDDAQYIHHGYTVRAELKREPVVVTPANEEAEEVIENRVFVVMGQRTYAESQLASLIDTVDVLVMESLLG